MKYSMYGDLGNITVLTKKSIKCFVCYTILESKYRHDFSSCSCDNEAHVDGGLVYQKLGARDLSKVENLSEHKTYRSEEYQALLDERQQVYEQRMQERVALGEVVKVGNQYYDVNVLKTLVDKCDLVKTILDDVKGDVK
jgi:hypothetical protein